MVLDVGARGFILLNMVFLEPPTFATDIRGRTPCPQFPLSSFLRESDLQAIQDGEKAVCAPLYGRRRQEGNFAPPSNDEDTTGQCIFAQVPFHFYIPETRFCLLKVQARYRDSRRNVPLFRPPPVSARHDSQERRKSLRQTLSRT